MNNVYLTGFMASGKSFYGKNLAHLLNLTFIDLDDVIEKQEKKSIPEIFSENGVEYFREVEHKAMLSIESFNDAIVATGGGTPAYYNHIEIMKKTGIIVFLNTPLNIIFDRVEKRETDRPLLKGYSGDLLREFIKNLFESRIIFYRQADLVINPFLLPPEALIGFIQKKRNT